jgi:hypothetical protein
MDEVVVKMGSEEPGVAPTMKASQINMLSRSIMVPNKLKIVSFEINVLTARIISLAGLVISAALAIFLVIRIRTGGAQIVLPHQNPRLKGLIVSLEDPTQLANFLQGKTLADVSSLGDLLKIAEHTQATILHQGREGDLETYAREDHYYVQSDNLVYHYILRTPVMAVEEEAAEVMPDDPQPETPTESTPFFKRLFGRFRRSNGTETPLEDSPPAMDDDEIAPARDHDETKN